MLRDRHALAKRALSCTHWCALTPFCIAHTRMHVYASRNEAPSTSTMKRIRTRAQEALGIPKAEIRGVYVVANVSAAAPWAREAARGGRGRKECRQRVLGGQGGCSGSWRRRAGWYDDKTFALSFRRGSGRGGRSMYSRRGWWRHGGEKGWRDGGELG